MQMRNILLLPISRLFRIEMKLKINREIKIKKIEKSHSKIK